MQIPPIIVLDGYDGSGKTTLATMLARELGGRYLKSYADSVGRLIWSLLGDREFDLADLVSRTACRKEHETNRDAPCLVFDRHWMTMFTLLPEAYHSGWDPLPRTFLCCADLETTMARLRARNEKTETPPAEHRLQQERFRSLAEVHGVAVIDTSHRTPAESLAGILTLLGRARS